ncbi:MAG: PAS domain S-box protein [Rhodocyclaceae bacterium]|nr:PAS domain S-box protein [Rhodocyclaceae bacterium]
MRLNIRTRIAIMLVVGLLVPALVVGGIQLRLEYERLAEQTAADQDLAADNLRLALEHPVWSFITDSVDDAVNTFMRDATVAHVSIDVGIYNGATQKNFMSATRPQGRAKSGRILLRPLTSDNRQFGQLTIEFDQEHLEEQLWARAHQMLVLIGSLLFSSIALLMLAARYGLIRPLLRLSRQAKALAQGEATTNPVPWTRNDEIGDLGRTFDWAAGALTTLVKTSEAAAEKFSSIFQTAPEWLTISRAHDGVFLEVNSGFEHASGWTASEAVGRSILELGIWPVVDQTFLDKLERDKGMRGYECDLVRKDGSVWSASVSAAMTTINDEVVVISVAHDITAMRQQEAALRASEARFAGMFLALPDHVTITRVADGRIVDVNAGFTEMSGWSREEAIGRTMADLKIWVNPADRDRYVGQVMRERVARNLEAPFRQKDGSIRHGSGYGALFEANGESYLVAITRDITETRQQEAALRASEARLAGMFGALPDAISITRLRDNIIIEVNDGFQWICGWAREQVVGHHASDLNLWANPADRTRFIADVAHDRVVWDFKTQFRRANGDIRDAKVSGATFEADGENYLVIVVRDVTEVMKQAAELRRSHEILVAGEQSLKHSYDMLANLQEDAGMGIWRFDIANEVFFWSKTMCDIHCFDGANAIEATLPMGFVCATRPHVASNFIHSDDVRRYMENLGNGVEQKKIGSLDYRIVRSDGVCRMLHFDGDMEFNAAGEVTFLFGYVQDITDQVAAEKAIRDLAMKFTSIFHTAPEWLTISRLDDGRFVEVNHGFEVASGWSAPEAVGRTIAELGIWPLPDQAFLDLLSSGQSVHDYECDLVRKDGSIWRAAFSAAIADINDEKMVISVVNDITEMRRKEQEARLSEQKFAAIFDAIPDAVVVTRARDGVIVNLNDQAAERVGRPISELIGQSSRELRLLVRQEDTKSFFGALATQGEIRDFEAESGHVRAIDSQRIRVSMSARMITLEGEPHVLGISRDVTDIRQQEAALHASVAARQAAEVANQMKSEFLAMISHEVRTPLGGVIGMLRFGLKDPGLAAGTRSKLHVGLSNAEILLQIINDILDYSKLEAGKMSLEVIDFDLPALIEDAKSILEDRAEAKSLSLVAEIAPDLPVWCRADPTRLRQVLINLVGNAIKFTETGEVRLCVRRQIAHGRASAVRRARQWHRHQCRGHPPHVQKFEQASADTSRKFGGTGLGLAISKRIVESMGGEISVSSEPGVGSTFSFWLPLELGTAPRSKPKIHKPTHTHRLNILCAEDGATNQIIIRELIEGMGHTIEIAEDGQAAVEALAKRDYDMVLMDSRMPRMNGIEALRLIRDGERGVRDAQIPVVALTANIGPEERERFFQAGGQWLSRQAHRRAPAAR